MVAPLFGKSNPIALLKADEHNFGAAGTFNPGNISA